MKKCLVFGTVILLVGFFTTYCDKSSSRKLKYDYLVLVNKYSKLPDDWEKNVELVSTKNVLNEDIKIEKETFKNYKKLKKALEKEGIVIELDSVYRSVDEQQKLWDDWSNDSDKGIEYVKKYVAAPGYSEHHTGLAIDICIRKDGKLISENDDLIAEKENFTKIHKKLADYGFILRYLEDKDDITGYAYEPWHLRYVGSKKVATEIMDKDITFEEYLESIADIKSNYEAAKYQIEKALKELFEHGDNSDDIENIRFNVTKIYSAEQEKEEPLKSYKFGKKDVAFEVTYEIEPVAGADIEKLTVVDGEYDKSLGWVKNISRIGILRFNSEDGSYSISNFGTGF